MIKIIWIIPPHHTFGSKEFKKISLVRAAEVTTYTKLNSGTLLMP